MATKRQLKKRIAQVCGELAAEILIASHIVEGVDRATVEKIVIRIATLQQETLAKVTFAYDKVRKDFSDDAQYRKARHAYYAAAYARLREDFGKEVVAILKEMNEVIPADQREKLK